MTAFPAQPFTGRVTDCNCEECSSISESLRNKSWNEVPDAFVDFTCSPMLLTPAALQAFVPAYMLRSLDLLVEADSVVVEFTVYSLTPALPEDDPLSRKSTRLRECARLMTAGQVTTIRDFLSFVLGRHRDAEWLSRFVGPALSSVWQ